MLYRILDARYLILDILLQRDRAKEVNSRIHDQTSRIYRRVLD